MDNKNQNKNMQIFVKHSYDNERNIYPLMALHRCKQQAARNEKNKLPVR